VDRLQNGSGNLPPWKMKFTSRGKFTPG